MGLIATLVVLVVYALGGLDWLELKTLDLRFRHASAIPDDGRIVCIDIDDRALEIVQRWPWPRDVQAGLIGVLHEAGLKTLLYDIELVEPEFARDISARNADIIASHAGEGLEFLDRAYPDRELQLALEDFGQVYLAFHHGAKRSGQHADRALVAGVKAWFAADPTRWALAPSTQLQGVFADVAESDAGNYEPSVVALRNVMGHRATVSDPIMPLAAVRSAAPAIDTITPVYFRHARVARRCGFVAIEPDGDGVVRRIQLLVEHDGVVLPQLAFAVAFDELGLRAEDVTATKGRLEMNLAERGEAIAIQLDRRGRALVPWVSRRNWAEQFGEHVPIGKAWEVFDRRQSIRRNQAYIVTRLAELPAATPYKDWQPYRDDLKRRLELESELRVARYGDDEKSAAQIREWMRQYDELLPLDETKLRAALPRCIEELSVRASGAETPVELEVLREISRAFAANDKHRADTDATMAWLRERLKGRIGLVGYTATALADMTPIPTHPRAPGVVAHANLLNGLLTGHTVRWAPAWLNILLAIAMGAASTLMSARWGPRMVGIVALLGVGYILSAGGLVFYANTYWIALSPAVGTLLASYVAVVVYRYVFLERESRQIARALSQYTSATLARQMAEDADLCRRAEKREVSAMFTDLAGFTTISERIGAERTQRVLNVTLGRLSDVMLHYEGMINKFIGDGIFAFWNPVIYPQPDHALRACGTGLDLQSGLAALMAEQSERGGDSVFQELYLRIGVATGPAVVGPCGSEQKYDYTCIGDSVNVASRLESANKFYGTRILVSGRTRELAGDGFAYRWLGGVQVKGKTQAVQIYELLGRNRDIDGETLRRAEDFARGIAAFQRRDWSTAMTAFEPCMAPSEVAAKRYMEATRQFMESPPAEDWNAALELTEK